LALSHLLAVFQKCVHEKGNAARNKVANLVTGKNAVALAEGGMRFTFPPYGGLATGETI
jgi:hypothetical protein